MDALLGVAICNLVLRLLETPTTANKMITLTVNEIYDLARFAGFPLDENVKPDEDEGESTITIGDCPDKGLSDEGDQVCRKYRHAAWSEEYPEEGMVGLGDEIPLENAKQS